jgi:hypothetical protein
LKIKAHPSNILGYNQKQLAEIFELSEDNFLEFVVLSSQEPKGG